MNKMVSLILGLSFLTAGLKAHPVSYKGAVSVMSMNQANMSDQWIHYSLTPRFSVGVRSIRLTEGSQDSWSHLSQFGLLVKRWNYDNFQANIYTFGGIGAHTYQDRNGFAALGGAKADIESRKYLFSQTYEALLQSKAKDFHRYTTRAGIAPYIADYDQLHTWLMVEYQFKPGYQRQHDVLPLLRFFYKNVLWEVGSSIKGEWLANFMVHF
ncbi:MAG: hypothetical protein JWQ35_451 [Bacteriovoracaceae bacterium]|nr:hypothetical protein [Bacteriovoracaceae bacterium]